MNFSKYKLQKYLTEGQTTERGATASITSSNQGTERSKLGAQSSMDQKQAGSARQRAQSTHKTASLTRMGSTMEHLDNINQEKELIKAYESQKSNWRQELQEKVADGQERENHPYVTVMPTGDENLIQAIKQMGKAVKDKKDMKDDRVMSYEEHNRNVVSELYKGKHGQTEKEYQDGRSDAGKMISGDSKVSGSAYSSRATSSTGPNPAGGSQKPQGQGRMGAKDREYLKYRKSMMKKEEVEELDEEKKCKEGYTRKDGKCVKKKKKKSSSKRTTIVFGGRPLYGYGGHHHHDNDNDNDGGDSGDGGGDGGGMGEMYDMLGDMLMQEMISPEGKKRMAKMKKEYDQAAKQPSVFDKMTDKAREQMTKATGPRKGSNYRGD